MITNQKKRSHKIGLPPGTMLHIGTKRSHAVSVSVIDYSNKKFEEAKAITISDLDPIKDKETVSWINVDGIHDLELLEQFGKQFDIHPLVLEDIVNTDQRPKLEDYENYLYVVLKMLFYKEEKKMVEAEQISMIIFKDYLITFQEKAGDIFEPIRQRLRENKGKLRSSGIDFLAYALLDSIVDHYFFILEKYGERIELLEEELVLNQNTETVHEIHRIKREMIQVRRSVWPLREVVNSLDRSENKLITKPTRFYLRDVYDHTIQVIDTVETYRDMIAGLLDVYLSSVSNRMNEVMKVLTIIATIFIPLTFIAGVYGMNFKFMPELSKTWGYPAVLFLMFIVAISMVIYFRRKKWL